MNTIKNNKYLMDISDLVGSMTIKLHSLAVHMNKQLSQYGVEYDADDLSTWPYYMNITGLPHSANTVIYFTTIEDNTVIELTKPNLELYKRSKSELSKFSNYYKEITAKFPGQELYIRGIINNIDIDDALNTYDGDILCYSKELVEDNEVNLIQYLSLSLGKYIVRWVNPKYLIVDDLYLAGVYSSITSHLIKQVYSKRLHNITTNEVHSYYQNLILNSNFNINEHAYILNKQAIIWLVKNINNIGQNIGKEETLDTIVENVLAPSGFDVSEIMIMNTERKTETLYAVNKITGNKHRIDIASILDSLIPDTSLKGLYSPTTYRRDSMENTLDHTRGMNERTKILFIKLSSYLADKELNYKDMIQNAILNYLSVYNNIYSFNTQSGRITLTSHQVLMSMLIAFFKLFKITDYHDARILNINNIYVVSTVDISLITTNSDRHVLLEELHTNINDILTSALSYVDRQLSVQFLIDFEISNSNNEIYSTEIALLKKEIVISKTITLDTTLGEYERTDLVKFNDAYDILVQVYAHFGKQFDSREATLMKLRMCQNLVRKVTSYVVHPIIYKGVIDGYAPIEPSMIMYGETIVNLTKISYDCDGVEALLTAYGSEFVDEISIIGTELLKEIYIRDLSPVVITREESVDDFVNVVKPRLT